MRNAQALHHSSSQVEFRAYLPPCFFSRLGRLHTFNDTRNRRAVRNEYFAAFHPVVHGLAGSAYRQCNLGSGQIKEHSPASEANAKGQALCLYQRN
jgi:hypothetical protein